MDAPRPKSFYTRRLFLLSNIEAHHRRKPVVCNLIRIKDIYWLQSEFHCNETRTRYDLPFLTFLWVNNALT